MRVFILAGEPSGDRLGGALMAGMKALEPNVAFSGVGGPTMMAQGLDSQFPMDELSVMGLVEVLPKYFQLKRRLDETIAAVLDCQPDVLITIDSPDFSLRVAKAVKEVSNVTTVHYVAPTVWAWRPKRAAKMAKMIDHVLALLPFEPPYMEAEGMTCDFVGHPVVNEPLASIEEIATFRTAYELGEAPILLVLPGSRRGEVQRLAPIFGEALTTYLTKNSDLRIVVPAAAPVAGLVQDAISDWPGAPIVIDPRQLDADTALSHKRAAFGTAELALAASGTVSLELAAAKTPMVMAYKTQWLTWQIARHMILTDTASLVNLVSETRVVPECLNADCAPPRIAAELQQVRQHLNTQVEAMTLTMQRLGLGGEDPGLRAARSVLAKVERR